MSLTFALIGNQNCGKTTLFNALTGSNQHVGNFPGVTVEKKEGAVKNADASVVDLPGIYSLSPYTSEEVVTRDFLINERPDGIINIVDATNLERNLYLSLQVLELYIPTVIALNMMDEVKENHQEINLAGLSEALGVPVVPISASKGDGIEELIAVAVKHAKDKIRPRKVDFCEGGAVHQAIHSIAKLIAPKAKKVGLPERYAATKLTEGDAPTEKLLSLSSDERKQIEFSVSVMEKNLGTDREAALADMRYAFIDGVCRANVTKPEQTIGQARSVKLDKLLTHRVFAIPIFLLVMLLIFWLTFGVLGQFLSGVMEGLITLATNGMQALLIKVNAPELVRSLVIDGIFAGVGSVLSFLPTILILFFFLSVLEDTGYMARVAYIMDKLLRKLGLSGRSFVPMVIGFGCSVPAIMATRTLSSDRDRRMTMLIVPFMSCSAKLPIYAMITDIFFAEHKALVMIALYILGMVIGVLYGLCFKNIFKAESTPFVMELPAYRFPSARNVGLHMWERAKDFIKKAFTIIFVATIVIWVLQTFNSRLVPVENGAESMLGVIGTAIAPVFAPLGFGDWRMSTALLTGLTAKEAVVSTLTVLVGANGAESLSAVMQGIISPLAAFSFLVFTLLYMPCVAAMAAIRRELNSFMGALAAMATQTGIAWLVSFAVYNVGLLFVR